MTTAVGGNGIPGTYTNAFNATSTTIGSVSQVSFASGTLTVQVAGTYAIRASLNLISGANGTGDDFALRLLKNGTTEIWTQ